MSAFDAIPPSTSSPRPFPGFPDLLRAETIKLRRSLILGLALLFPLGLLMIAILVGFLVIKPADHATWRNWMSFTLVPWSNFLLPMMICLLSSLLLNLEHQNHQWKHLHALPIQRWKHFAAKQALLGLLLALSHGLLFLGLWLGGWALRLARPGIHFEAPSAPLVASLLGFILLASWAVAAVHTWLAARFPNLGVNVGIGLGGVMFIAVVARRPAMARAFPWAMPGCSLSDWMGGPEAVSPWVSVGLSVAMGFALLALACWDAQTRESES
jgi:hypothetical protein